MSLSSLAATNVSRICTDYLLEDPIGVRGFVAAIGQVYRSYVNTHILAQRPDLGSIYLPQFLDEAANKGDLDFLSEIRQNQPRTIDFVIFAVTRSTLNPSCRMKVLAEYSVDTTSLKLLPDGTTCDLALIFREKATVPYSLTSLQTILFHPNSKDYDYLSRASFLFHQAKLALKFQQREVFKFLVKQIKIFFNSSLRTNERLSFLISNTTQLFHMAAGQHDVEILTILATILLQNYTLEFQLRFTKTAVTKGFIGIAYKVLKAIERAPIDDKTWCAIGARAKTAEMVRLFFSFPKTKSLSSGLLDLCIVLASRPGHLEVLFSIPYVKQQFFIHPQSSPEAAQLRSDLILTVPTLKDLEVLLGSGLYDDDSESIAERMEMMESFEVVKRLSETAAFDRMNSSDLIFVYKAGVSKNNPQIFEVLINHKRFNDLDLITLGEQLVVAVENGNATIVKMMLASPRMRQLASDQLEELVEAAKNIIDQPLLEEVVKFLSHFKDDPMRNFMKEVQGLLK